MAELYPSDMQMDPINMELMSQFASLIKPTHVLDNPIFNNFHNLLPFFSNETLHVFPQNVSANYNSQVAEAVRGAELVNIVVPAKTELREEKKRKAIDKSESSSGISIPQVSEAGIKKRNSWGRGKRIKRNNNVKEEENPKEVVHVRARRGQATDSHSLAERVRREKINERLRCLQDIVPGCYKTMGMAVMLDEIINYIQSLQNQVEFLSMKLTAAATFYDFNSETDAVEELQRAKAHEAKGLDLMKMMMMQREGYGGLGCSSSTICPL